MQVNVLIVLLLYLLSFLARSHSVTVKENNMIVDSKTCEKMLEAFWEMKDTNMEGEYQLITTEKFNSKPEALNRILSDREHFVEYQRESRQSALTCSCYTMNGNNLQLN